MRIEIGSHLIPGQSGLRQRFFEFAPDLCFRFTECHLDPAVRIDFAFTRRFDRQIDDISIVIDHRSLDAVALRTRQTPERFERKNHMGETLVGVVDVFRYFEMAFPPVATGVVVRMAETLQLILVGQFVHRPAKRLTEPVVFSTENPLADRHHPDLFPKCEFLAEPLEGLRPWHKHVACFYALAVLCRLLRMKEHVDDPRSHRFGQDFRVFPLQKTEHVEIAVAFCRLRPQLAGNLHYRLHPQPVDLDGIEPGADMAQGPGVIFTEHLIQEFPDIIRMPGQIREVLQDTPRHAVFDLKPLLILYHAMQIVEALFKHLIGFSGIHFIGTDLVCEAGHEVTEIQGI